MAFRIPEDDRVADAIFSVMYRNQQVSSQNEMVRLVRHELNKNSDEEYRISGERIRRIALNRNMLQIAIDYRDDESLGLPDVCPVCKNPMESLMNMTLTGDKVEIKRKCTVCPFSVGQSGRIPGRYTFLRKPKR